jgi:hypothetical protein
VLDGRHGQPKTEEGANVLIRCVIQFDILRLDSSVVEHLAHIQGACVQSSVWPLSSSCYFNRLWALATKFGSQAGRLSAYLRTLSLISSVSVISMDIMILQIGGSDEVLLRLLRQKSILGKQKRDG